MASEMMYIVPNTSKWERFEPKSASKLTMEGIKWSDDGNVVSLSIKSDFAYVNTMGIPNFPLISTFLTEGLMTFSHKIKQTSFIEDLEVEVATCIMYMSKARRYSVGDESVNEALVQMVYGNPIVFMLCGLQRYWFRLEDKMYGPEDADEGILEKSVTEKSMANFYPYLESISVSPKAS